ncbi:MAG: hypothetical protein WBY53_09610 [Acidobacteriaceae bacterium]
MATLILTTLPFVLTFSVAAWKTPSKQAQPRSDASCHDCPTPCQN